jgi:hypothetical protein
MYSLGELMSTASSLGYDVEVEPVGQGTATVITAIRRGVVLTVNGETLAAAISEMVIKIIKTEQL